MAPKNLSNGNESEEEMEVDRAQEGHDSDEDGGIRIDEDIYIPPRPAEFGEVDTTGPRLMITHINNFNFKSYAGEQRVGHFHKVCIFKYLFLFKLCWKINFWRRFYF